MSRTLGIRPVSGGVLLCMALLVAAACSSSDGDARSTSGDDTASVGTDAPSSGELLALAYNVAGLPAPLSGSDPETNMPLIGPLLDGYELVLLQESWRTPDDNPFAPLRVYHEELESRASHPHKSDPATQPFGADPARPEALLADGLNRFSRHPFGEVTRVAWTDCFGGADTSDRGAADCLAFKGFSVATHTLAPGVEVDVYNLHAEAGSSERDQELQHDNFDQLATFIEQHSAGRAVILGGDTNLHTSPTPRNPQDLADTGIWETFLERTGLTDVCTALSCPQPERIDKFAFRSGGGVDLEARSWSFETEVFARDDGEPLSDHDALAVRFAWSRQP